MLMGYAILQGRLGDARYVQINDSFNDFMYFYLLVRVQQYLLTYAVTICFIRVIGVC
jgi:hypothetical protein